MAKRSKILIALCGLAAGIIIGIVWVILNQQDFISEDEARAVVTDRYGGSVESVSLSDDDRYFIINLKGASATHSIKVDREDSSVQGIETVSENKSAEETAEKDNKDSKEENKAAEQPEEQKEEKQQKDQAETTEKTEEKAPEKEPENKALTVDQAVNIAQGEVGGTNVYSTWSGEGEVREYYILQLVNDDDEGALVSINGITGHVNKVVWLEIDDDYEEIEQLVYEATQYANMYDNRYIEYDDDYFDD